MERGLESALKHIGRHFAGLKTEVLEDDARYGLKDGWTTVRVTLGEHEHVPPGGIRPFRVRKRKGPRHRRLYVHDSGFVIEGGRGGARIFDCRRVPEHSYYTALLYPVARARSITLASKIVLGLSADPIAALMVVAKLLTDRIDGAMEGKTEGLPTTGEIYAVIDLGLGGKGEVLPRQKVLDEAARIMEDAEWMRAQIAKSAGIPLSCLHASHGGSE